MEAKYPFWNLHGHSRLDGANNRGGGNFYLYPWSLGSLCQGPCQWAYRVSLFLITPFVGQYMVCPRDVNIISETGVDRYGFPAYNPFTSSLMQLAFSNETSPNPTNPGTHDTGFLS